MPAELTYFPVSGFLGTTTVNGSELPFNATAVCTPRLPAGFTALISNLDTGSGTGADTALAFPPQPFTSVNGVITGALLANDATVLGPALAAAGITQLWYDVNFTQVSLGYQVPQSYSFPAPTTATPVSLTGPSLTRYAYGGTVPVVSLPAGVTAFGVSLIGAANEAAAQALLGIPSGALSAFLGTVSSQAAMLALSAAATGDFCYRSDLNSFYYLTATPPGTLANWVAPEALPAIADNTDGTMSVAGVNVLEPLSTVTIVTASTAPVIGRTTYYNATSGNLTPPLPALSGLRVGARLAVRRDPADVSNNTVTLTCAGSDTFYSSGATTATLPMSGEQREYQVVSQSGTKYWSPAGSLNPVAALDQRYLAGASKLVSIGDMGQGTGFNVTTSTVGTSEMMFKVGVAVTGVSALWEHWYTAGIGSQCADTDPAGAISFNASLRVVSSTNPATVTGTIYRLTFGGRTTATLDPGGRIAADVLGISLAPGDVVAVRTYLASGTAYVTRTIQGAYSSTVGGFTSSGDLTAPGSAAIAASQSNSFGPSALLGYGSLSSKSVLLLGDSISAGYGDSGALFTIPALGTAGFAVRALTGVAGLINCGVSGDAALWFQSTTGSLRRLSNAQRCNTAIIEYGANDINIRSVTATSLQTMLLNVATDVRRLGIAKVFLTTITPLTTSTDGWITTTNQTPAATESQRVAHNTWVRANCPVNPTTLAPVAVGTAGALTAGQFGHPVTGFFDNAAVVESSLNSGLWLPAQRVVTGSMTAAGATLTSSGASFNSSNQEVGGDKGTYVALAGAGASGAYLTGCVVAAVTNSTTVVVTPPANTTVTNAQLGIGVMTGDGLHPSSRGANLIAAAMNIAVL